MDQAVSWNKCFIIYRTTPKNYVVCRNTAKAGKLKVHVLQLLNSQRNVTFMRHETHVARQNIFVDKSVFLTGVLSCRVTLFERLRHNLLQPTTSSASM